MSFEYAVRLTEIIMGFAFCLQSLEHILIKKASTGSISFERALFFVRLILSLLLIIGIEQAWMLALLFIVALINLHRYQGPYNGGADRMSLLILISLCLVYFLPQQQWREMAFAYLAVQLILSYFVSGYVKVVNPDWRTGRALMDVFLFSVYPVSKSLRRWANRPRVLFYMSWAVMLFELLFPLALFSNIILLVALIIAMLFHLANLFLFGLNRFFWIWIAAYPSILWFQDRVITLGSY